jgi:hypothetical protein
VCSMSSAAKNSVNIASALGVYSDIIGTDLRNPQLALMI